VSDDLASWRRKASTNVSALRGAARRFIAPQTIEVQLRDGGKRRLVGESVFLDVGTTATISDIAGLSTLTPLTHVEALDLDYV
jgi:pyruvate/2-oxoglutarate dehydrogenase complex dihydrolipoamide dehydrogenase (E3) component